MEAAELLPRSDADKFLTIPYEERWECLKPVIVSYYLGPDGGKGNTLDQLVKFMKDHYAFSAHVHQYRHRLKKWGVRKRTFTLEKDEIVNALGKRSRSNATTSDITLEHGKRVNKKQLTRYLKDQIRHGEPEPLAPGAFLMWNLPYAAYSRAFGARSDAPSPFDTTGTTPTYVNVQSPEAHTPGHQTQGATPTTQLVNQKWARDRSSLLLQARHLDLLESCGREQRVVLTNYLHDFYIHSYVAAKFWGRGPKQWTSGMISVLTLFETSTPKSIAAGPSAVGSHDVDEALDAPTQLCRWSIHVRTEQYDPLPEELGSDRDSDNDFFDVSDPGSWKEWSDSEKQKAALSMVVGMEKSLALSTFSHTPPESLPISVQSVS